MRTRKLGRSEIDITPLGLGCWQFSAGRGIAGRYWPALPPETVREIVSAALDGGINWFDTAEAYGDGASEAALSHALHTLGRKDGDVIVATKWAPYPPRTARSIVDTIGERLRHLDGFSIDLHQVHMPAGSLSSHSAQMKAMAKLVETGKIRSVGVSNFSARQMRKCHEVLAGLGVPLVANQVRYNLLDRSIEGNDVLSTARELGVTIIAYSPLAQGILSGRFHADPKALAAAGFMRRMRSDFRRGNLARSAPLIDVLREIAATHGVKPAQVALNWLVSFHGDSVVAIPGATKRRHVEESTAALGFTLEREELDRIDEASRAFV